MINENEDYVIKSKLTITVKRLSKYNGRSRVVAKQKNRPRGKETGKHLRRKIKRHTNKHTSRLTVNTRTQR